MTRRLVFPLAALLTATALTAGPAPAQTQLEKDLARASKDYDQKVGTAKQRAVKYFDAQLAQTKSANGLTPAARADKMDKLRAAQKQFKENGRFPPDDEFAQQELDYMLAVNEAYLPLARLAEQQIDKGLKADNQAQVEAGRKLKAAVEAKLPARGPMAGVWRGTFTRGGTTIPLHLAVRPDGAVRFAGHVEDNPGVGGNWGYDVEGQTSGLGVEFALTKSTRGKFKSVHAIGIVSGDRLIAEMKTSTGGKPTSGLIVLTRGR